MTPETWRLIIAVWQAAERVGRDVTLHVDLIPEMCRLMEQEAARIETAIAVTVNPKDTGLAA